MNFQPLTDDQINQLQQRLAPGEATFSVTEAHQGLSSKGSPMISLMLNMWDKNGTNQPVKAWLVITPAMMWKLKHFCEAVKKPEWYANGDIPVEQLVGLSGACVLETSKSDPRFVDVKDYIFKSIPQPMSTSNSPADELEDDDLPF